MEKKIPIPIARISNENDETTKMTMKSQPIVPTATATAYGVTTFVGMHVLCSMVRVNSKNICVCCGIYSPSRITHLTSHIVQTEPN